MRIILDATEVYETRGSHFRYFREMIPRIAAFPDVAVEVLPSPTQAITPEISPNAVLKKRLFPSARWFPDGKLKQWLSVRKKALEKWLLLKTAKGKGPALFHSFYYTLSPDPSVPLLAMVHDLITEIFADRFPGQDDLSRRKERAVRRAAHVMADSENTRQDLIRIYGVDPAKVTVVHLGVNYEYFARPHSPEDEATARAKFGLTRPYCLYVGDRLNHKNFPRFAEGFAASAASRELDLVVAGHRWLPEETKLLADLGLEPKLAFRPDEDDLRMLYRLAKVFAYPSLYEGFGLPPLEAMASGVPVLAARAGSIPEVSGDAPVYCDPEDASDIARGLERLLDPATAAAAVERGHRRARGLSWEKTAAETIALYKRVLAL